MSGKVLQINFKFHVPVDQYDQAVTPLAAPIADVPGLIWKVWTLNEAESEAGGVYLFRDAASLQGYLDGLIVAQIVSNPALSDFSLKTFDVMEAQTRVTRGPVREVVPA